MKAGKIWGQTELILANPAVEFHRITVNPGGECSKHKHVHKFNGFYVQHGRLIIRTWKNDYDLVDETELNSGEFHVVAPGEFHQFFSPAACVAFELYWAASLDGSDILRETVGSIGTPERWKKMKEVGFE